MQHTVTILDATTRQPIKGKLIKQYPLGVTIDDDREIRHYATFDRVIGGQAGINPIDWTKAAHAPLF